MENDAEKKLVDNLRRKKKAANTRIKRMSKCVGKITHRSQKNAEIARDCQLRKATQRGNPIVTLLNVYQCEKCGGWHVGSNKKVIMWDLIPGLK